MFDSIILYLLVSSYLDELFHSKVGISAFSNRPMHHFNEFAVMLFCILCFSVSLRTDFNTLN